MGGLTGQRRGDRERHASQHRSGRTTTEETAHAGLLVEQRPIGMFIIA
jgi:hypothetical protein